ncbi:MAG: translation initiation factor IF-2 [Candidatus Andersenbacteria bacterium]|nr:translation initiation factor IF-2 [Candidatus Andersenbacteria bacterium]
MTNPEENKKKEKAVLEISENIIVKDLAEKMSVEVTALISELIKNKIFANINEALDFDTAEIVADFFGFELKKTESVAEKRKQQLKKNIGPGAKKRPPVVVVMGHVDHGKTTLLDKILQTNVAKGESGGITQNVSAYQVKKKGETITFIDTPGHEAFRSMRERGAYITDLAVIVVAADDGVKPQTIEAVKFVKEAGVPVLVAINKIDKPEKNIEKVKKELAEIDLTPEGWGGKTVCVNISAKTGEGIDELLDMIILASDMEEIKADPNCPAEGFVIESHLDPQIGPVAVILIQNGTLKEGDYVSVGPIWGRIKRMENYSGKRVHKAIPSMPVTVMGLNEAPKVGAFLIGETSRLVAEKRAKEFNKIQTEGEAGGKVISTAKIKELVKSHKMKKFNIILKADTKGSLEAIIQILESIESEDVAVQILKMGVGNITETDVKMAHSSGAKIIGFNVSINSATEKFAEKEKIEVKIYKVIYELVNEIKEDLTSILEPEIVRTDLGILKVIAIFKSGKKAAKKVDMIVGAKVESGKIEKRSLLEIIRNGEKIGEGTVKELQANKKVVSEVKKGKDAGITFEGNVIIEDGDVLNAYKEEKVKRKI